MDNRKTCQLFVADLSASRIWICTIFPFNMVTFVRFPRRQWRWQRRRMNAINRHHAMWTTTKVKKIAIYRLPSAKCRIERALFGRVPWMLRCGISSSLVKSRVKLPDRWWCDWRRRDCIRIGSGRQSIVFGSSESELALFGGLRWSDTGAVKWLKKNKIILYKNRHVINYTAFW